MGLIKAAKDAIGSTLHDQWKEVIRCDDMTNDVLMMKRTSPNGVISNGSIIVVAPGQCAIIYDNGRVIDATAEDGTYTFDTSSTPSFFAGQFKETFREMWERFTFDGVSSKQQAVFFFNLKEILDNKFGTATPIPYQDWSHPIPNRMTNTINPLSVNVRCFGKYTFRISNPALFMSEIAGTAEVFRKDALLEQMRTEVMAVFQNLLNELGTSEHKIPVLELPSQTDEIKQVMDEKVFDEPIRKRGLMIEGFAIESVTLDEESQSKINNYELSSNAYLQQGTLTTAYANAVQDAAKNANGPANGFMGIGIMNMATGGAVNNAVQGVWQQGGPQETNSINYDPFSNQQPVQPQQPVEQQPVQSQQPVEQQPVQSQQPVDQQPVQSQQSVDQQPVQPQQSVEQQPVQQQQPVEQQVIQPQPTEQEQTEEQQENIKEETLENNSSAGKLCLKCGNINPKGAKFCNNCGNQF